MKTLHLFKTFIMSIFMLTLGLGSAVSMAGNYEKIQGQFNQAYTKQEAVTIPQTQGHMVMLTQSKGKNTNTNGAGYMHGAQVVIDEIIDLNQGNGPHSGYVIQTMPNGDETVTKYSGLVTTTLTLEGQPNTTMAGKWEKFRGKGQYTGVTGSGTYTGHFVSESEYVIDYNGYIYVP